MKINNQIFQNFNDCPYKVLLCAQEKEGEKCSYEKLILALRLKERKVYFRNLKRDYNPIELLNVDIISNNILKQGKHILYDGNLELNNLTTRFDALEKTDGESKLGDFHYQPILIMDTPTATKNDKLLMAYWGFLLAKFQGVKPNHGKVIPFPNQRTRKLKIATLYPQVKKTLDDIQKIISKKQTPILRLNPHCNICEFQKLCRKEALKKDDLSLLNTIRSKEISKKNKRGIFTVTQLSYTFRPRRRRIQRQHLPELKALAIRENKIHVIDKPKLPLSQVTLFLDAEGDPNSRMDYLLGLLVIEYGRKSFRNFWANNPSEQKEMYQDFVSHINKYNDYILYHYGSYETKLLKRMKEKLEGEWKHAVDNILKNSINILGLIYPNIYFPTYSNALKEVGNYLGYKWSNKDDSGIKALYWLKLWEVTKSHRLKKKLIEYNKQDCEALRVVVDCIESIIKKDEIQSIDDENNLVWTKDIKDNRLYGFKRNRFCIEDMAYVNKCAYSDYQRDKIYVRTNPLLKQKLLRTKLKKRIITKPNKIIKFSRPYRCNHCNSGKIYKVNICSKRQVDFVFFQFGIKKWFIEYQATRYKCSQCKGFFFNKNYELIRGRYGWNLICWVIFQKIACRQSWEQIIRTMNDFYGVSINKNTFQVFHNKTASYYTNTYNNILKNLLSSDLLHIDETRGSVRKDNGYVWAFTNMESVYFLYKKTREGEFLKDLLDDFSGVLLSDFYTAYDSIECMHQRCLVHLIRDLNDDLFKNPFDEDFKELVLQFGTLLRTVITTIDQFGLKRRHLLKHKKDVAKFFDYLDNNSSNSDLYMKYRKKLFRQRKRLFTFLEHDGIPWNNNNAETAIKSFVLFRKESKGLFSERTIKKYLILLSVYQTCSFKGFGFFDFLKSREINIDDYIENCGYSKKINYEHKFGTCLSQTENPKKKSLYTGSY